MKKQFSSKTSTVKISILVLAFIISGIFLIAGRINITINKIYKDNLEEIALHDKNLIYQRLNSYWDSIDKTTDDIRNWYNFDGTDIQKLLNADSNFIPHVYSLDLLAEDGTLYKSSGNPEYHPEYIDFCKNNQSNQIIRINRLNHNAEASKDVLTFIKPVTPIIADNHIFLYVFCSVFIKGLEKDFKIPSFEGESWSCIADEDGQFLVHINQGNHSLDDINIYNLLDVNKIKEFKTISEIKERLNSEEEALAIKTNIHYTNGNVSEDVFMLFSPVPKTSWLLISVIPADIYTKPTIKIMSIVFILLSLIVVTFIIIVILVIRQRQKQQNISNQMFDRFSQGFTSVYLVNAKDNSYRVLKRTPYLNKAYPIKLNFTSSIDSYIKKDVFPADRQILEETTRHEYILERLQNIDKFTIRFRDISCRNDSPHWYEMTAARVDIGDTFSYLLGFADNHEKVLEDFIRERMYDSYNSIYYIDLINDRFKVLKYPITTDIFNGLDNHSWKEASDAFINEYCDEESQIMMKTCISDVKQLHKDINIEHHREYLYRWKEGEKPWRRVSVHAFERNKNDITSVIIAVSMLDDFSSERQELTRQLHTALENAKAASKAKTMFLNNMSHDIRTPMNAILGFTDIAKKHLKDEGKVLESLEKVTSAGEHLLSLINDVLDMSRIESGTIEITTIESDIRKIGNEISPIFDNLAAEKNIDFTISVGKIKNPIVKLDRLRMNQIIINIVSNAIKYTNRGGKVTLSTFQKESEHPGYGKYVFMVQDNGIGMSKEFQKHIFETFSREQTDSVEKNEGTGLGLSIVKRLIDLMGGSIEVESEQGKGSTFTIETELEISEGFLEEENISEEIKNIENLKGKHILLVDDNDFNREITRENLEDVGIITEEAINGQDAFEKVHLAGSSYFDCILMDVQMPIMNGYEATQAIRKLGGGFWELPIIALSANAFEEDIQKSKESGMNAHLSKPIRIKKLIEILNRYM